MRMLRGILLGVLALLSLAACARGETVTAQQIMDGLQQARETTRNAHGIVELTVDGSDQDGPFLVELWMNKSEQTDAAGKPLVQSRAKVLETSRDELAGTELVNDGTTIWLWNPGRNTVVTGKLADLRQGQIGDQDPTAQIIQMQEQLQQLLDGSNVEILAENEPVAGRDAWKVKLTPKPETAEQMQIGSAIDTTLWVGHERYIPLKAVISASDLGRAEMTVQQVELDQGVDPSTFVFTPPTGAEVVDAAELARKARPTTTTLDEARKQVSFAVLAPEPLPDGVVLDEVQILSLGGQTVIQNYSGSLAFSLVQTQGDRDPAGDAPFGAKSESVTVRGQPGTLITGSGADQGALLRWQENGVTIVIAGTVNAEQSQAIAESLR